MPNSYPSPSTRLLAILGGTPLLALALCAGAREAPAADRAASPVPSHSTRDIGNPAPTGLEACPTRGSSAKAATPATPGDAPGASGTRVAPAAGQLQAAPRDRSTERGGGSQPLKRSRDGRVMPRAPRDEPRRGGVGTLIGITFA